MIRCQSSTRPLAFLSLLACLCAFSILGPADRAAAEGGNDAGAIKYRQTLMEGIGSDMGAISDILKYGLPLADSIEGHARSMAALSELVQAAFKQKVTDGPTDAKPEIWSDAAGFETAGTDFGAAVSKLVEVAGGGDTAAIGAQLQAVGKTCGGCHKSFRKPKEESFKNDGDSDSDSH